MANQPLLVILYQILSFTYIYIKYIICKHIL